MLWLQILKLVSLFLAAQCHSLKGIGFGDAGILLPNGTIRLSFCMTVGEMICSSFSLAMEEITMPRDTGGFHRNAFPIGHRPSSWRCHLLVLWPSFYLHISFQSPIPYTTVVHTNIQFNTTYLQIYSIRSDHWDHTQQLVIQTYSLTLHIYKLNHSNIQLNTTYLQTHSSHSDLRDHTQQLFILTYSLTQHIYKHTPPVPISETTHNSWSY